MGRGAGRAAAALSRVEGQRLWVHPSAFFPGTSSLPEATIIKVMAGDSVDGIDLRVSEVQGFAIRGLVVAPEHFAEQVTVTACAGETNTIASRSAVTCPSRTLTRPGQPFTLWGVPPGEYRLSVEPAPPSRPQSAPRREDSYSAELTLRVDADVDGVVMELRPGRTLQGRLLWEGARPPTSGIAVSWDPIRPVRLDDAASGASTIGAVLEGDRFTAMPLRPRRYQIQVRAPDGWVLSGVTMGSRTLTGNTIQLDSDIHDIVLVMTRAAQVTARLAGADAAGPVARLLVFPAAGWDWSRAHDDPLRVREMLWPSTGVLHLRDIPPGDYFAVAIREEDFDYRWRDQGGARRLPGGAVRFTARPDGSHEVSVPLTRR